MQTVGVFTIDQAGSALRAALAAGPKIRTVRILLDPTTEEVKPWLESARNATPETRGMMVQLFFAWIFREAGYDVVVGRKLDILARGKLRSVFVEVKSSLNGGMFGSKADITQLEDYLVASQRFRAMRWLGIMGINKPIRLRDAFRIDLQSKHIGLLDIRWISAEDTLTPHLLSVDDCGTV